jgi:hypothetical protein
MFKYFLIAIWVLFFAPSAHAQAEPSPVPPSFPLMPAYEERDTLVKYSDGVYQERLFIQRIRIDSLYVADQERQVVERKKKEAKEEAAVKEMRKRLKEEKDPKDPKEPKSTRAPNAPKKGG